MSLDCKDKGIRKSYPMSGYIVQTATRKVDPARKIKCTTAVCAQRLSSNVTYINTVAEIIVLSKMKIKL